MAINKDSKWQHHWKTFLRIATTVTVTIVVLFFVMLIVKGCSGPIPLRWEPPIVCDEPLRLESPRGEC